MRNLSNVPTPWGRSQGGQELAIGIKNYHTAGHGGVKVIKKLNEQIPFGFRHLDGWYEEDCDSNIVFYFFHALIEAHMTANSMPGWSCTAEEYFSKFTKAWFRDYLESSGYYIPACIQHFGAVYPPKKMDEYGRDKLEAALKRIKRREHQQMPRKGDNVTFDAPIRFFGGYVAQVFTYQRGNCFRAIDGTGVRILGWQSLDFETSGG